MGSIYIQEPPTHGKVLLRTSFGDIDIELWSKEAPNACRNFVQLCLEGYYDNTIFHRVVKGFIAQGGDPNGDGTGGESIYNKPFKDEFHSRLRFVRRGLVAMANAGKDDNGSQFFFTLSATPELQSKHTIFGKIAGDTIYNMLKLEDCIVDEDDKPIYPYKIISTKILMNPFPDIIPRAVVKSKSKKKDEVVQLKQKNFKLLSFGEEAEEEDTEENSVIESLRGKSKSSHDLPDQQLSSVSSASLYEGKALQDAKKELQLENIRKKLKVSDSSETQNEKIFLPKDETTEITNKRDKIREEIMSLKKELRKSKKTLDSNTSCPLTGDKTDSPNESSSTASGNILLSEYHTQLEHYHQKKKIIPDNSKEREKQTLKYLTQFCDKLKSVQTKTNETAKEKNDDDSDEESWLNPNLHFDNEEKTVLAHDASLPNAEKYDITDPRHPINERRRKSSKRKN